MKDYDKPFVMGWTCIPTMRQLFLASLNQAYNIGSDRLLRCLPTAPITEVAPGPWLSTADSPSTKVKLCSAVGSLNIRELRSGTVALKHSCRLLVKSPTLSDIADDILIELNLYYLKLLPGNLRVSWHLSLTRPGKTSESNAPRSTFSCRYMTPWPDNSPPIWPIRA